jgi:NAD(P)-dependent dehydrogenase (short-subunit alcohol dehydrogenase family)
MQLDLADRGALVTGGATGIGRATALELALAGAKVAIVDVDDVRAKETVEEIRRGGGTALSVCADVSDPTAIDAAVTSAADAFGAIYCAVNAAAVTVTDHRHPTAEVEIDVFDRIIAVDLRGTFLSMKYELRHMVAQGEGSIVNISSGSGLVASKFNPSYIAAKHGVIGLTKAAALDHADDGVRVNVVAPGVTRTPMIADVPAEYMATIESGIPLGRVAEPTEIAQAIVWLCSPLSSYATGSTLVIDGGYVAQ